MLFQLKVHMYDVKISSGAFAVTPSYDAIGLEMSPVHLSMLHV